MVIEKEDNEWGKLGLLCESKRKWCMFEVLAYFTYALISFLSLIWEIQTQATELELSPLSLSRKNI